MRSSLLRSLCVFFSLIGTRVIGFRARPYPEWSHLDVLSKLCSPNKVTRMGSGGTWIWGATLAPTTAGKELSPSFRAPKGSVGWPPARWLECGAWLLPSDPVLELSLLCLYHRRLALQVSASLQLAAASARHWPRAGGQGEGSTWCIPPLCSLLRASTVSMAAAALLMDEPAVVLSFFRWPWSLALGPLLPPSVLLD